MRKETLEAAEEQVFVEMPVGEFAADVLEETFTMGEPAEEMVETILEGEYSVTEKSKSIQRDAMSQELNYMELLAELQSQFVCLQYEFQYNLDKISNLDYEHRYKIRIMLLIKPIWHAFWISRLISINGRRNYPSAVCFKKI